MIPKLAIVNVLLLIVIVLSGYGLYRRITLSLQNEVPLGDLPIPPERDLKFPIRSDTPSPEAIASILQNNLFRKARQEWFPSPTPTAPATPTAPVPTPTIAVPDPELQLFGVVIIGESKMAILEGTYSVLEKKKVTIREQDPHVSGAPQYITREVVKEVPKSVPVKRKQHRLGEVIGEFYIADILSDRVLLRNVNDESREVVVLLRDPNRPKNLPGAQPTPGKKSVPASTPVSPAEAAPPPVVPTFTPAPHVSGAETGNSP